MRRGFDGVGGGLTMSVHVDVEARVKESKLLGCTLYILLDLFVVQVCNVRLIDVHQIPEDA